MGTRSGGGLSCWWPTPARPGDWFDDDELRRSAQVHRPIHRIKVLVVGGQITLLVGCVWVLGVADESSAWVADAGRGARAAIAATAVLVALQLPTVVGQRAVRRLGHVQAIGPAENDRVRSAVVRLGAQFVAWSTSVSVSFCLLGLMALGLSPLADRRWGPVIVGAAVGAHVLGRLVSSSVRRRSAVETIAPSEWDELAEQARLDQPIRYGLLGPTGPSGGPAGDPPTDHVVNACVDGLGRSPQILVSRGVLAAGPSLGRFVVAHEMTHLSRRHLEARLVAESGALALVVAAGSFLVRSGWPWSAVGWSADDPLSLPVAVLVLGAALAVARLLLAWLQRGFERSADLGAAELATIPSVEAVRSLVGQAELDPPWVARLLSGHPAPAERLAFVARLRSHTVGRAARSAAQSA